MHLSGAVSASLSEDVRQRVTDSLALHADGNFEATQWLMQIGRQPELLELLRWLLHPAVVFPPLSVECKTFACLTRKQQEALHFEQSQHVASKPSEAVARAAEAYLFLDETAKLAAFQLLLEAVKKPARVWSDDERRLMEESVLAFVHCASPEALSFSLPPNAPPAAIAASSARRAPPLSLLMKAAQSLAALHCCAQTKSENALSERLLLLQLSVWSTGLSTDALSANAVLRGRALNQDGGQLMQELVADRERELLQLSPEQRQQRFVAACVFLGVLKELGQELQDEEGSLMNSLEPRVRRAKATELRNGLAEETTFLLQICRFLLALHSRDPETRRRIQPLALECIRYLAGFGELRAVLRCLCSWGLGGEEFQGAEVSLLQILDVVREQLQRRRHKKTAIDGIDVESVTAFLLLVVRSASAAFSARLTSDCIDEQLFSVQLLVASVIKNLTDGSAEFFVRKLPPSLTAVFLRLAVLPAILHPSLKISSLGVTAAASLIRKFCSDANTRREVPEWIDSSALLSAFFLRCLRVGDPQVLRLMQRQAVLDLEAVAERLWGAALSNSSSKLSAAVAACQEKEASLRREASEMPSDPELLVRAEACRSAADLLRSLPSEAAPPVKGWLRLRDSVECPQIAAYSEVDDSQGTEALEGFSPRFAGLKSQTLLALTALLGFSPEAAETTSSWIFDICREALQSPLFVQRAACADSLLVRQLEAVAANKTFILSDKLQPWLFPSYVLLDGCCCFVEALAQRLKNAALTFEANVSGGSAASAKISVSWMLPQNADEASWTQRLCCVYTALVQLPLFDAKAAREAESRVSVAKTRASEGNAEAAVSLCQGLSLHDYLLESRRLELLAGAAYFCAFKAVNVQSVLELLFKHIMESETSTPHSANPCAYPLPASQQVYVCRRKALHALICLANASPKALRNFLPLLLQHVQSRIHESEQGSVRQKRRSVSFSLSTSSMVALTRQKTQALKAERGLLIEVLVSLVSSTKRFDLQQQHTIPLVQPFADALLELTSQTLPKILDELQKQMQQPLPPVAALAAHLFGDLRSPIQSEAEAEAANRRRSLARVVSSLEVCLKRTFTPSDPTEALEGGYYVEVHPDSSATGSSPQSAGNSTDSSGATLDLSVSFEEAFSNLLRSSPCGGPLNRRHPLAGLVTAMLPALFELIDRIQQLWTQQLREVFPLLPPLLSPGLEEFLSLEGANCVWASDPTGLSRVVLQTFPVETEKGECPSASKDREERDAAVKLARRHCFHLRGLAYRLLGECAGVTDAFYFFPQLPLCLRQVLFQPLQVLPLSHVEQQLRLAWSAILNVERLPPQPPFPATRLVLFFVEEGVVPLIRRLRSEWSTLAEAKRSLEASGAEEERRMNLYLLHLSAVSNVASALLEVLENLFHVKGASASSTLSQNKAQSSGTGPSACTAVAASPSDFDGLLRLDSNPSQTQPNAGAASSSAQSVLETQRLLYSSPSLLQPLVACLLEVQRWPQPQLIQNALSVLRTYVKTATKVGTSAPPPCTVPICAFALGQLLASFFDASSFDPLDFGAACNSSSAAQTPRLPPSSSSCTPLEKFKSGVDAPGGGPSHVGEFTSTVYHILRALLKCLTAKLGSQDNMPLTPASLVGCPQTFAAFQLLTSGDVRTDYLLTLANEAELPRPMSAEEAEALVRSLLVSDAKESKGQIKAFLQRNRNAVLNEEDGHSRIEFTQAPPLAKALLQRVSCDLGDTFLSAVL